MGAVALDPICPAATAVGNGILCAVLRDDHELRDHILTGDALDPFYDLATDPSVVLNACCGTALPIEPPVTAMDRLIHDVPFDPEDTTSRHAHYTNCLVWQLHIERERFAGEGGLGLDSIEPVGWQRAAMADTYGTVDPAIAEARAEEMERDPGYRPPTEQQPVTAGDLAGWSED